MQILWALLMPAGTAILRLVPLRVAEALAAFVGTLAYRLQTERRQAIEANLMRTAPDAAPDQRRALARATFRNFAMTFVDTLRLPALGRQGILDLVDPVTHAAARREVDGLLAGGRGLVLVSMHLGPIDLSGAYLAANGWPVTSVAEDIAPRLFDVWRRYRTTSGLRLLSQRHASVATLRALSRGELVALVTDRVIIGPSTLVNFCGGQRMMPSGPAAFALKAGAPVIVGCLVREPGRHRYLALFERVPTAGRTADELTQAIATVFSKIVSRYPDQWFVFQPQWIAFEGADADVAGGAAPVAYRMP